ncbi:MAG: hypothetical protein HY835_02870 [Anaerolineae bacterium]|nr:hypothetical protein [Anaerolineae bacterium]
MSVAAFPEPGLWSTVWKLLRLRIMIAVNGFKRAKRGTKVGIIFGVLGVLVFLGFVLFISISLLNFLRSPALQQYLGNLTAFVESFPTMLVSVSTAGILVTGFGVLLQALYLSGDMDFLMSAPVPMRAIFVAKLIQAVLPNFLIMCVFTLPILIGLGISGGYNLLYYPMVVIVLVMLSLSAAALASLLVMVAARFFPARRMAEVLGFVVGTSFFVFSQSARFMNFDVEGDQVASLLNTTARFNQPWSPLSWAGNGLIALGKGEWLPGIGLLLLTLVITSGVFYAALATSERLYYTGWSSLQNNRRAKARAKTNGAAIKVNGPNALARLIPAPVRAIMVKDLRMYRRDLRNVSQLITPIILGVVYAFSLLQQGGEVPGGRGEAPAWIMRSLEAVFLYADVGLALFLGWMLVQNLAGIGFSQEGRSYWMLKSAPLGPRTLIMAKFLVAFLPAWLVCGIYVLVLQILKGASPLSMLITLLALGFILMGLTGIYLAFGIQGAKFNWDTVQQMNQAVGCLGTLVGMAYVPVCFVLLAGPPAVVVILGWPVLVGQLIGLLLGAAAGLGGAWIALSLVEKRVPMLNE